MFGAAAACRAKHRLQPCEPKPRPAEARKTRSAGFGTRTTPIPLSKPIIACELQNRRTRKTGAKKTPDKTNNSLYPPAPLRRQRTAESTNHADTNHDPHHSGCEVAGSEDKTKIIDAEKSPERSAVRRSMNDSQNNAISINSGKKNRAKNNSKENSQRRPNRMCKFVPK